ncbi:MAG: hypothetical protein ACKO6F_10845 [Cyanobium sp.]
MDFVLLDGDQALFQPAFGAAVVVVRPGVLRGSGPASVNGKAVAIDGDESSVAVQGCLYQSAAYPIPGTGTLEVAALAGDQRSQNSRSGGQPLLLVGGAFTARFRVQAPAQQPTPSGPVPDPLTEYSGQGQFLSSNQILRAS